MGWSPDAGSLRRRLASALERRLRIDPRSLAALRVALGVLLLADLALRTRNLTAFYTDDGVLPRSAHAVATASTRYSLHLVSGEAWVQLLLFALAGAVALALLVGYRTRLATLASWLLLLSLHNRIPDVLNGGDTLLLLLLFWAIFLPLGAAWSVDARHAGRDSNPVLSVAGVALLSQVVIVYVVNAALKWSGDAWLAGEGLQYAYSLRQFTVFLGDVIGNYPALLVPLDYLWLGTITLSVLVVVLTGYRRVGYVALLASLHMGMLLTMRIDLFPLISIASLLPFLPADFWDAVEARVARSNPVKTLDAALDRLAAWLPHVSTPNVPASMQRATVVGTTLVPLGFLVLVVLWNLQFLGYNDVVGRDVLPEEGEYVVELSGTDQYWNMFAPDPLDTDGWLVVPGLLENGTRVDAFHGGSVTWDRPPDVSDTYPSARWRKYIVGLWRYNTLDRRYFAEYLCSRWNARHETPLRNLTVVYVEQPTRLDAAMEPTNRVRLGARRC